MKEANLFDESTFITALTMSPTDLKSPNIKTNQNTNPTISGAVSSNHNPNAQLSVQKPKKEAIANANGATIFNRRDSVQ